MSSISSKIPLLQIEDNLTKLTSTYKYKLKEDFFAKNLGKGIIALT